VIVFHFAKEYSLNRRKFLVGAAGVPLFAQKRAAVAPPNVLLIMAGQLPAYALGCYGSKEIHTPNIDRLAKGGMRMMSCFGCAPAGSANRATLYTGRTPMQHGIQDFLTDRPVENPPQGQFAPPPSFQNEIMLSDILAAQGYRCGYVGRWDMGSDQTPQHKFEYWYTMLAGPGSYQNPRMSLNGQTVEEQGYLAELVTQHAQHFLDDQKPDKPFFLVVSHFNPHPPYDGHPQKYFEMYAKAKFDTIGWEPASPNAGSGKEYLKDIIGSIRKAAASTTALDDQVAALLDRLQQRGLRDNTLVIFTSDTGSLWARHGLWGADHASEPANLFDDALRVPMIWNWPGRVPIEGARSEVVSSYDFIPTVCEAVGAPAPAKNLCGRSFLTIVTGGIPAKKEAWRNLVFGRLRNMGMARDNRYKLVLRNEGKGPNELYDVRVDSREKTNQYDNPQFLTVRDRLAGELAAWTRKYSA
jgi:arylsulfatase A-like enzyme